MLNRKVRSASPRLNVYGFITDWNAVLIGEDGKALRDNVPGTDDSSDIAYGELEDNVGTGGEYKPFTINIEYRDDRQPSYIILVAVASKYADYFTGGVGSVMYIDEFSFGFDYVE